MIKLTYDIQSNRIFRIVHREMMTQASSLPHDVAYLLLKAAADISLLDLSNLSSTSRSFRKSFESHRDSLIGPVFERTVGKYGARALRKFKKYREKDTPLTLGIYIGATKLHLRVCCFARAMNIIFRKRDTYYESGVNSFGQLYGYNSCANDQLAEDSHSGREFDPWISATYVWSQYGVWDVRNTILEKELWGDGAGAEASQSGDEILPLRLDMLGAVLAYYRATTYRFSGSQNWTESRLDDPLVDAVEMFAYGLCEEHSERYKNELREGMMAEETEYECNQIFDRIVQRMPERIVIQILQDTCGWKLLGMMMGVWGKGKNQRLDLMKIADDIELSVEHENVMERWRSMRDEFDIAGLWDIEIGLKGWDYDDYLYLIKAVEQRIADEDAD